MMIIIIIIIIIMSPQFKVGWHIVFPRASVCLSQSCPLYNLKTVQAIFTKLYIDISQH